MGSASPCLVLHLPSLLSRCLLYPPLSCWPDLCVQSSPHASCQPSTMAARRSEQRWPRTLQSGSTRRSNHQHRHNEIATRTCVERDIERMCSVVERERERVLVNSLAAPTLCLLILLRWRPASRLRCHRRTIQSVASTSSNQLSTAMLPCSTDAELMKCCQRWRMELDPVPGRLARALCCGTGSL